MHTLRSSNSHLDRHNRKFLLQADLLQEGDISNQLLDNIVFMQCTGTLSGLLSQTIRAHQQDISLLCTSMSESLCKLTIEAPAHDLSAAGCCANMAPLEAVQQLMLSCSSRRRRFHLSYWMAEACRTSMTSLLIKV